MSYLIIYLLGVALGLSIALIMIKRDTIIEEEEELPESGGALCSIQGAKIFVNPFMQKDQACFLKNSNSFYVHPETAVKLKKHRR